LSVRLLNLAEVQSKFNLIRDVRGRAGDRGGLSMARSMENKARELIVHRAFASCSDEIARMLVL
jgi:hypothetical protein